MMTVSQIWLVTGGNWHKGEEKKKKKELWSSFLQNIPKKIKHFIAIRYKINKCLDRVCALRG